MSVCGATGAQGEGLVRAILRDSQGGFAARAIARDVNSDKARELARMGAEVVAADIDEFSNLMGQEIPATAFHLKPSGS
ncbi:MAG TPA: NmrA family NAD(P)-binding protein [Candidatus Acidoferrales bacterium]|nr:NmrA family NAD(P)-binding protein [Candidatus Acidoferrales bacterium]